MDTIIRRVIIRRYGVLDKIVMAHGGLKAHTWTLCQGCCKMIKLDFYKCPICLYQLSVPGGQILMPFIKKCPKCNVELKKQD